MRATADGINLSVEYRYLESGELRVGVVEFAYFVAYRFRGELHSEGSPLESYDSIVEIHDSDWLREIVRVEPPGTLWPWKKRHFAQFLSNHGYLEVIADHFQEQPPRRKGPL